MILIPACRWPAFEVTRLALLGLPDEVSVEPLTGEPDHRLLFVVRPRSLRMMSMSMSECQVCRSRGADPVPGGTGQLPAQVTNQILILGSFRQSGGCRSPSRSTVGEVLSGLEPG